MTNAKRALCDRVPSDRQRIDGTVPWPVNSWAYLVPRVVGILCKQGEGLTMHAAADSPAIVAKAQRVDSPGRQRFTH